MIDATFESGRRVYAMILDEPAGLSNDVFGIVQCANCDAYSVIVQVGKEPPTTEQITTHIEDFAEAHRCPNTYSFTKDQLLAELRKQRGQK